MQRITYKQAQRAARKWFLAGQLIAQSGEVVYAYRHGNYRCAFGAAFNAETLREIEQRGMFDGAITDSIVKVSKKDQPKIAAIQHAHDYWMVHRDGSEFRKLINV